MGYSTNFTGQFDLEKPLAVEHYSYLKRFAKIRHMRWLDEKVEHMADPTRTAVGLPAGFEGMYLTNDLVMEESYGHHYPHNSAIIDYNREPAGVPGLWLQWVPTEDWKAIEWDGGEKFYDYVSWVKFLVAHFLVPWGYVLNGRVEWQGEDPDDRGAIIVENNVVMAQEMSAQN
jgi:hypothetical protein